MTHILIVPSFYPTKRDSVTGTFIEKQAKALNKAGHQVGVLVTPRLSATREHARLHGVTSLRTATRETYCKDFPVYRMHWGWFPRPIPPMVAFLLEQAGAAAFERYMKAHGRPDVLHPHNTFYGGYLAARLGERYGIPVVLTEHSSSFLEGLVIFPGQGRIARYVLTHTDARLVVGSSLIKPLQRYAPASTYEIVGNVIDTDLFTPGDTPPPHSPFIFGVIAQFRERRKGFDILIPAFARAFRGQDVYLKIRGDGPMRDEIEAMIRAEGVESQVSIHGRMSMPELRDFIRACHVIASSSYVETFGVSIAEGMACGKPVVATISGGPEDYVTPESGILVPAGDPAALAAGMQTIRAEYERFDARTIRQICVDQFSEQALVRRLEAIYSAAAKK